MECVLNVPPNPAGAPPPVDVASSVVVVIGDVPNVADPDPTVSCLAAAGRFVAGERDRDADGLAAPGDFAGTVPRGDPEGLATAELTSTESGPETLCLWLADGRDPYDDGGLCVDDDDTEIVTWEWIAEQQPTPSPSATPAPVRASPPPTVEPAAAEPRKRPPHEDDDDLGFALVADRRLSLAIDAALVLLALVVLWRSSWIRLIVVESFRHPSTAVTLVRGGSRAGA